MFRRKKPPQPDPVSDGAIPSMFAHLFRSSPLGFCVVDDKLRYVEVNQSWCDFLGYSRDDMLAKTIVDVTHPDHLSADRDLSARLFAGQIPHFRIDKKWVRKDGSIFSGHLIASVLHREGSPPWGIAIVEAEREVELVSLSGSTGVAQLVRGAGHDLNNLLTVIQGSAEAIESEQGRTENVVAIEDAVQRAASLARGLILAGRPPEPARARSRVNEVLARLGLVLSRLLPTKIVLETSLCESDPEVEIAAIHLDQVLMNLVVNARDAMQDGGGTLSITVACEGGFAGIEVADTGPGLPPELLERVFEPFFTTKPAARGTGMGLAIVRSIVEQAGGRVRVESTVGRGAQFWVSLPLCL